jgi:hypothetical protein
MDITRECPECGADWTEGKTCQECFHQMLAWEWEDPGNLVVHHLTVLGYHLQHPGLYSPEGLAQAKGLLVDFLEAAVSPTEVRRRMRGEVDSSNRDWQIKGTPTSHGSYDPPIKWPMTAPGVIEGGITDYCDNVRAWARSILNSLRAAGHLPSTMSPE